MEAAVAASSKEAVTGNVLIWFLCAIAFLKVSQKIDSFMATLGVNVGRTGSSMLAEVMIATRGVTTVAGFAGHTLGRGRGTASSAGVSGTSSSAGGFFKGGLIGMAGRKITNSAVKTATTQTSAVHTAQKQAGATVHTASEKQSFAVAHTNNTVQSGGSTYTDSRSQTDHVSQQEGVIVTGQNAPSVQADQGQISDSAIHWLTTFPLRRSPTASSTPEITAMSSWSRWSRSTFCSAAPGNSAVSSIPLSAT